MKSRKHVNPRLGRVKAIVFLEMVSAGRWSDTQASISDFGRKLFYGQSHLDSQLPICRA